MIHKQKHSYNFISNNKMKLIKIGKIKVKDDIIIN